MIYPPPHEALRTEETGASPALQPEAGFLVPSPYLADGGAEIGALPGDLAVDQLRSLGHPETPLAAIRAKCCDCVHNATEIRKCVQTSCALWPYRMGRNPFHASAKQPGGG